MNLKELREWFYNELKDVSECSETDAIFKRLLEHHGVQFIDVVLNKNAALEIMEWEKYVAQLKTGKPIQYILGYEWFCDMKFLVNKNVLIPRPETEELVNWVATSHVVQKGKIKILDIGTGSGCIAIALKKRLLAAEVYATDVSAAALDLAATNAERHSTDITFMEDDILNSKIIEKNFDIIVSNPPYIPIDESVHIAKGVKDFEPSKALFTEAKKPLQFYQIICVFAKKHLSERGSLFFETHEEYSGEVKSMAESIGFYATVKKDIFSKDRMMHLTTTIE